MLCFFKLSFFDSFSCSIKSCVSGFDFMNTSETSSTNLFKYRVIFEVISFFHFNELIPFDFDFLYFLKIFDGINCGLLLIVLDFPVFGLMSLHINLRLGLLLNRLMILNFELNRMNIMKMSFRTELTSPRKSRWSRIKNLAVFGNLLSHYLFTILIRIILFIEFRIIDFSF